MRKLVITLIAVVVVVMMGTQKHVESAIVFEATLSGSQEVPPNSSTATGTAELILKNMGTPNVALEYLIEVIGLDFAGLKTPFDTDDDVTRAHIHNAPAGVNGPIIFGIIDPNNDNNPIDRDITFTNGVGVLTLTGIWQETDITNVVPLRLSDFVDELLAGEMYINIHTNAFPGGEIRGQITAAAAVPEPGTLLLIGSGLVGMGAVARRRS